MPRGRAYRFLTTPTGQNPTTREFQRAVRSHAASVSHPERVTRRQTRTRARIQGEGVIVFDVDPTNPGEERDRRLLPAAAYSGELATASRGDQSGQNQPLIPYAQRNTYLSINYLSGNTFSPLQHLATYHKPYIPGIINHYIYNLTIPVPELDGNSAVPLFRAAWLPVVFHDPVVFQVVILFAATHYATYADPSQYNNLYLELLSLKQSALSALIHRVQSEQNMPSILTNQGRDSSDTLIAAVAKMASYEAIFGTGEAFHLHMSTVTRLLSQQGGMAALGMNGFLARLLSFIDTNSSFLLGTNLYLVEFGLANRMPLHQPFPPRRVDEVVTEVQPPVRNTNVVNLERFIGIMSVNDGNNEGSQHS